MKKLLALLLAAVMVVSLAACDTDTTIDNDTGWVSSYVPSDKAAVTSSYMVDGEAKFVVHLSDDVDVVKVGLACMYFDEFGNLLGEYELLSCTVDNNPYTSWETSAPSDAMYTLAAVAYTTDSEGNKENCKAIEDWAKETEEKFTVSGHKAQLAAWAKDAKKAESSDYVKIESLTCTGTTLDIELTNLTTEELSKIQVYLLLFDENGYPIDAGGNSCPNSKLVELVNLLGEENATYEYTVPEETVSAKGIIRFVEVEDEIVWQNEYLFEWLFSNYSSAD